jgi:hypothetical protein
MDEGTGEIGGGSLIKNEPIHQIPDTKKPAIKAGFFLTCISRQKTT